MEGLTDTDFRKTGQPRFQEENLGHNAKLFEELKRMALKKGCTPGQLALAWVQHQGDDIVAIPGTTKVQNFQENIGALHVKLTQEELRDIEAIFHVDAAAGPRYPSMPDGETPPLSSWKGS